MGIPLISGLLGGGGDGAKKREEEAAAREAERKAEEEAEARREAEQQAAEERARAAEEAAAEQRESARATFERREVREDDRGAPVLNQPSSRDTQRAALESIASTDAPQFQMSIPEDEIRFEANVDIPEDEIRFTPNAPAPQAPPPDPYARVLAAADRYTQQATPQRRTVDFGALDAQADEADMASRQSAAANLGAPPPPAPTPPPASAAATPPAGPPGSSAPIPPPQSPAAPSLPQQQAQADAQQRTVTPRGAQIPQDVRTAAMPPTESESALRAPTMPQAGAAAPTQAAGSSDEDEARRALRNERIMKALAMITRIGLGAGGVALGARGGSPHAARVLGAVGGAVGGALDSGSPTAQAARVQQARARDEGRARQSEALDLQRVQQAAAQRRQELQDALAARRADLDARRVSALEEGVGLRARQVEAQAGAAEALAMQRTAQGERAQMEADDARMARDPESPVSRQAQAELRALMERVPESERISDEEIGSLSADAATTLYNQVARRYGLRTRQTQQRSGAGGPARNNTLLGAAPQSFAEYARREYPQLAGLSPEEQQARISEMWRRLSGTERRPYISGSAMADTREDQEMVARANAIPGWSFADPAVPPDTVTVRTAQQLAASDGTMNRSLSTALRELEGIDVAARARSGIGWDTPETQRFRSAIDTAISEMTSYVNTGALNEADQARYERMFGSLTDLVSNDVIRARLSTIRSDLAAKVRTRMGTLGFQPGGGQSPGGGGQFIITPPDGTPRRTSNQDVARRARERGWRVEGGS